MRTCNRPCHHGSNQENNTHCEYDHPPPTTFAELASVGPPNCTYILINGRPSGENHKGSLDFWRREKHVLLLDVSLHRSLERARDRQMY